MEKLRLFLALSVLALLVAACGGGGGTTSSNETPSQPVTVSLSELSAVVEISSIHQFNATVENADDESVDWQVNKVSGGNSTVGTISESGLFTAPDRVPAPVTVTVTAVAHADATKEASARVTIMSNVTIAVSPANTTLPAGETLQLTATIENAKDAAALWHVNDVPGGDATVGMISSAGLYTAPSLPPPGGVVTVTAISLADTSKADSVNVTVQFSNASFSGPYVFDIGWYTEIGPFYAVGRFVADGNGNIVSGVEDLRTGGQTMHMPITGGTYTVEPDGRGSLSLPGGPQPGQARFELTTAGEGALLQFENLSTGSGRFYKQDAGSFSNPSTKGSYVMEMLGAESSSNTIAGVGVFTLDGAGNITGIQDMNDNGNVLTKMSINGTYSIDLNGRAMVTTVAGSDTSETVLYLISSDRAVGVPWTMGSGSGLIWMEKQQITNFSNASLSGDYVYWMMGDPTVNPRFFLGRLTLDGAGNISAGIGDANKGGMISISMPIAGSYSIPPTDHGRGTVNMTTASEGTGGAIIYLVSEKKAFMITTDATEANGGQIVAQEGVPFSPGSPQGTFVHSLRGFNVVAQVGVGKLGSLSLDGNGSLSGVQAVNFGGLLNPNVALTGTYSHDPNGRGHITISDGTFQEDYIFYIVDSSHVYLLYTGPDAALFGSMVSQF